MATAAQAQAVKSLNSSSTGSRQRFVFKTFAERVDEINVDVYRSLDKGKVEPSQGSFFLDCLVEWRELNTAEDFISLYEKLMPFVQTLPLVLIHKNLIFEELLSRLHIKARLSLEAIFRSIAALSRDLVEEFVPFLPRIADSLLSLLQSGADREPDIIEQIFTAWSCIIMNLRKELVQDVSYVLKFTIGLRYYSKGYVQEFMAAATSFLLRNASKEQQRKGIGKLISEVVKKPLLARKNGVSALLYYVMRGTASRLHSKAEGILHLLTNNSIFIIGDKHEEGSATIIEVVSSTLKRLCEELEQEELNKIWSCLYKKIEDCMTNNRMPHLSRILSLTTLIVQIQKGRKVPDFQQLLEHIRLLVQKFIVPSGISEVGEYLSEVRGKIFTLMLFVLEGLHNSNNFSMISRCSVEWMPMFELKDMSCLTFITELIEKDPYILSAFRDNIWRAMSNIIESSTKDVVYLLVSLCEKLENPISSEKTSETAFWRICSFLQEMVSSWICKIRALVDDATSVVIDESELALMWGVINCFCYMLEFEEYKLKENGKWETVSSLSMDLIDAFDRLMSLETEIIAGINKNSFLSLIGAALRSYAKCGQDTKKVLDLSRKYKSSAQVLSAVADYLDHVHGLPEDMEHQEKAYHLEFQGEKTTEAFCIYGDNLFNQDKRIRVATLRILRHYETPDRESCGDEQPTKKLKNEGSEACAVTSSSFDVVQLILSIETTTLSVSTSRKVILLISRIQMGLSSGRISRAYLPIILSGMSGMFHNRFSYLWNPASECLAVLINQHFSLVWDKFIHYFEHCLALFRTSGEEQREDYAEISNGSEDLLGLFNMVTAPAAESTPYSTVLSSLLQTLQKVPSCAESRSRQIIPLFLKFLGYKNDSPASVGSFDDDACKGKEWKCVLSEWLNLLKLMRHPKAFYRSKFVKDVLYFRLMDENDAELQLKVLDCLLTWKDAYLLPYEQHLKKLISSKGLREELTTWSLSKESQLIEESHRTDLVPLTILLLMPKVRNLKTLASRKHTSLYHRKAILGFLAQLDVNEIPFFFALLLKPFHVISSKGDDVAADFFWTLSNCSVVEFHQWNILEHFTADKIMALSWKKRYAFLHLIEDILGVFDESRVMPFLDLLIGCVVRILSSCKLTVKDNYEKEDAEANQALANSSLKQMKDLRSLCLKIISLVLNKYDDHDFGVEFWDMFFTSVKPLIDGFKFEGASSEKPSSLFSCFLAVSSSRRLAPLLLREKNLVPNIFSILTVTTASEAIISSALKFIENLLVLDEELEDGDNMVKGILLPNIDDLISGLHFLFQRDVSAKRKTTKYLGESCLRIFKLLSKYVKDLHLGKRFMEVLVPLLSRKAKDPSYTGECLKVIQDIVPVIGTECTTKILNSVSEFLVSCETVLRLSVCDLLDDLAKSDHSVFLLAKLIRGLNATSAFEVDDRDLDAILTAYKTISVEFYRDIEEEHAIVVLSHCIHDMSSDVYILRQSAYSSLLHFVEFSSQILGGTEHQCEMQLMAKDSERSWTRACIQRIINKFLLKHLGNVIKAGSLITKEWIDLLQGMVVKLPNVEGLNSCKPLCSEDPEQDFFYNITHIQKHRRARALSRFKNVVGKSNISEGILNSVFVPLFFNMLLDVHDKKGEHIKIACLEALASISGQMGWKSYYGLLMRCFREIKMKEDMQKILVRLICSILEQFHFSAIEIGHPIHTNSCEDSAVLRKCSSSRMETDIQSSLHESVLPKIQKLLGSDSGHVNVNISLAVLKVLKLLPGDIMDSQLPSIMHRIANQLKNRLESIRDEARLALAACLKELGLEYLQFIVKVMQATLKRGYELHVLGYSLHFILSKSLANAIHGKLDYCLTDLLSVVENDILGDVAEEKEVEKIASKMKETKKQKSFETLQLIAQNVTFKSHALKLLSPVTASMQKHLTPKVKNKLESMLSHIAAGLERNPSVEQNDLFIFTYGLIEDGLNEENGLGKNPNIEQSIKPDHDLGGKTSALAVGTTHSNLITVFALGLFHSQVKSLTMVKNDETILSMLDPFVKLLANCLRSKYEDVLSACLKCLAPLIRLPLPSLESHADKIKLRLLDIAQSSMNANSPLMQSCLKLLSVLLRSTKVTLSSDQLHSLVQFPLFLDLERNHSVIALSLLKAIVGRKLVVPEIYDIALRVGQLMVTSQIESIRKKCSQILLQFLLDYHLSETYLQQQMDFLLKNLSYEYSTGREAVLEMLHAVIIKFPKSFLDKHSLPLFIHLVQRLVNDDHGKVCLMTGAVIKLLIGRISQHFADSILDYSLSWYMDKKRQLKISGAQALGLLVEVMGKNFKKHINVILPMVKSILQSAVDFASGRPLEENSDDSFPLWKEAYFTLVMLEKILQHFQDLSFEKDLEEIWESVSRLLLHPHAWLRNISSRIVAFYFVTASKVNREKSVGSDIIMRPDRLFVIAASLCCQLQTKSIEETAGKLIAENLVFAVCTINSLIETLECRDSCKFWSSLKEHEKGRLLSGLQLLDSTKGRDAFLRVISNSHSQDGGSQGSNLQHLLVSSLLKKMGKVALQGEAIQMKTVFSSFEKIASQFNPDSLQVYSFDILLPLYKVREGYAGKVISDDLKQLAGEVCESIRNTLGIQNFINTYNEVKTVLKGKREKRKREEKLMPVVNPVRNAKRKLKMAAKHRAHKKRKIMTMKMGRWMR